jgi:hypothetical protein
MELVPCAPNGAADFVQRTTLDGREYVLRFRWSQRAGAWTFDLADADGAPIRCGLGLRASYRLLRGVIDARRPPGELFLIDATGALADPGFDDLGTRHELYYVAAAELGT